LEKKLAHKTNIDLKANFLQLKAKVKNYFQFKISHIISKAIAMKIKPINCTYGESLSLKFQVNRPENGQDISIQSTVNRFGTPCTIIIMLQWQ